MSENPSMRGERRSGVDRRTLIKRAAAAGAVAWTAPAIIGSIASPAAAATQVGCFKIAINDDSSCSTLTFPSSSDSGCVDPAVAACCGGSYSPSASAYTTFFNSMGSCADATETFTVRGDISCKITKATWRSANTTTSGGTCSTTSVSVAVDQRSVQFTGGPRNNYEIWLQCC